MKILISAGAALYALLFLGVAAFVNPAQGQTMISVGDDVLVHSVCMTEAHLAIEKRLVEGGLDAAVQEFTLRLATGECIAFQEPMLGTIEEIRPGVPSSDDGVVMYGIRLGENVWSAHFERYYGA